MDPIVKKFHQHSAQRNRTPKKKVSFLGSSPSRSSSRLSPLPQKQKQSNYQAISQKSHILEKLIEFLQNCLTQKCIHAGHQRSPCRYICLEQNCSKNIGCAYCFLYGHQSHTKAEIQVCIRDLKDLNGIAEYSMDVMEKKKKILREKIIIELDQQIDNICNQFHSSIQFIKNKALNEIQSHLFERQKLNLEIFSTFRDQTEEQLIATLTQMDIKKIQSDFQQKINKIDNQKLKLNIFMKYFQQMNSSMSYFMSQFKRSFPKLYRPLNKESGFLVSQFDKQTC